MNARSWQHELNTGKNGIPGDHAALRGDAIGKATLTQRGGTGATGVVGSAGASPPLFSAGATWEEIDPGEQEHEPEQEPESEPAEAEAEEVEPENTEALARLDAAPAEDTAAGGDEGAGEAAGESEAPDASAAGGASAADEAEDEAAPSAMPSDALELECIMSWSGGQSAAWIAIKDLRGASVGAIRAAARRAGKLWPKRTSEQARDNAVEMKFRQIDDPIGTADAIDRQRYIVPGQKSKGATPSATTSASR